MTIFSFALARCAKNLNFRAHHGGLHQGLLCIQHTMQCHSSPPLPMACFTPLKMTIIFFTRLGAQCCEACRAVREGEYANGAKHGYYYYNYYCDMNWWKCKWLQLLHTITTLDTDTVTTWCTTSKTSWSYSYDVVHYKQNKLVIRR